MFVSLEMRRTGTNSPPCVPAEVALRGGDQRQVEDPEVQGQPRKGRLQEAGPQPEASRRRRLRRPMRLRRRRCLQGLQDGAALPPPALIQPA